MNGPNENESFEVVRKLQLNEIWMNRFPVLNKNTKGIFVAFWIIRDHNLNIMK